MILNHIDPEKPIAPQVPEDSKISPAKPVSQDWQVSDLDIVTSHVGFHQGPRQRRSGARLIIWSFAAAFIDACFVSGLALLFFASFLFVVKSSWGEGLVIGVGDYVYLSILTGGLVFSSIYMIMLRSFLGFTLGDWACGLRLGSPSQRESPYYTLRVLLRSLVLLMTGVLPLPILSLLLKKDLPGKISGLSLISLR